LQILIIGLSTRALAESAVKAGYNVVTIDFFGDFDQRRLVKNLSLMRDFNLPPSEKNFLKVFPIFSSQVDFLVYTSPFENFPETVKKFENKLKILGNDHKCLKKSRNWRLVRSFLKESGIPFPETIFPEERPPHSGGWLEKPEKGGGGYKIKLWGGKGIKRGFFLQKQIKGKPCSAVFVADGEKGLILGLTEQLIGIKEFGGEDFKWCGNIFPLEFKDRMNGESKLLSRMEKIINTLTKAFNLRGINGLDFIINEETGDPVITEVNPRYPASAELIEFSSGISVFDLHVKACSGGISDSFFPIGRRSSEYFGKAILYAKKDIKIPEELSVFLSGKIKDIPFPGELIREGKPVCSVFSTGETREVCFEGLLRTVNVIEKQILRVLGETSG
jgi:predicted ATP-grasp superfamily ATP-dependent carboligase